MGGRRVKKGMFENNGLLARRLATSPPVHPEACLHASCAGQVHVHMQTQKTIPRTSQIEARAILKTVEIKAEERVREREREKETEKDRKTEEMETCSSGKVSQPAN